MTLWEKLRFWWRRLVSSSSDEQVFVRLRLDQLRERIGSRGDLFVDWDNRLFLPGFAARLFAFYRQVAPTVPFFRVVWKDQETVRRMTEWLLAKRVPGAKTALHQFVTMQELQETYRKTENRAALKQLVLDRVSEYINGIHPDVIRSIEAGLLPVYILKEIVLFDFGSLFSQFRVEISALTSEIVPEFRAAAASRVIDAVEEFFLTVHSAGKMGDTAQLFPELVRFFLLARAGEIGTPILEPPSDAGEESGVDPTEERSLQDALSAVNKELRSLREQVPFVEIIRYFREDPYYRYLAYVPKVRLLDFYHAHLKIVLLAALDERFNDLRVGVMGKLLQECFPQRMVEFEFFVPEIPRSLVKAGIRGLSLHRTMQIVLNFVVQTYKADMSDFFRILGRIVPARGREALSELTLLVAGFDDVSERIRAFDFSFAGETDVGKAIGRFRFSTERDQAQFAAVKALVAQKEREVTTIIEKFVDLVRGARAMLERLRRLPHEHLNERYAGYDSTAVSQVAFDDRLNRLIRILDNVDKAVGQMMAIEREQ